MILGRPLVECTHYTRVSRTHMRTKLKVLHVTYVVVVCNKSCQTVLQVKRLLSVLFYAFLSLSTASKRVVSESKDSQFCFAPLKQWLRNLCQTCTTTIQRRDSLAGGFTRPSIVVIPDWVGCTSSACQF